MEPSQPRAQAVAVKGRDIVYVGDQRGVQPWIGPGTQRVNLKGTLLLPGLIDSHVHPFVGSLFRSGLSLDINAREQEVLASIAAYAKANPGTGVIFGNGWDSNLFRDQVGPNRRDLDAIRTDCPILLMSSDLHSAWANSKALQLAGITAATPDPAVAAWRYRTPLWSNCCSNAIAAALTCTFTPSAMPRCGRSSMPWRAAGTRISCRNSPWPIGNWPPTLTRHAWPGSSR
jgi:predicted amidohydrolase YtcJ